MEERISYKNSKENVNASVRHTYCEDTTDNKLSFSQSRNPDRIQHAAGKG